MALLTVLLHHQSHCKVKLLLTLLILPVNLYTPASFSSSTCEGQIRKGSTFNHGNYIYYRCSGWNSGSVTISAFIDIFGTFVSSRSIGFLLINCTYLYITHNLLLCQSVELMMMTFWSDFLVWPSLRWVCYLVYVFTLFFYYSSSLYILSFLCIKGQRSIRVKRSLGMCLHAFI